MKVKPCSNPKCGAIKGHNLLCYNQKDSDRIKLLEEVYLRQLRQLSTNANWHGRLCSQVTLWQGKFRIVKAENNALRRKLHI